VRLTERVPVPLQLFWNVEPPLKLIFQAISWVHCAPPVGLPPE
jgi:hypothetical protein